MQKVMLCSIWSFVQVYRTCPWICQMSHFYNCSRPVLDVKGQTFVLLQSMRHIVEPIGSLQRKTADLLNKLHGKIEELYMHWQTQEGEGRSSHACARKLVCRDNTVTVYLVCSFAKQQSNHRWFVQTSEPEISRPLSGAPEAVDVVDLIPVVGAQCSPVYM